jgi:hypothetical protein
VTRSCISNLLRLVMILGWAGIGCSGGGNGGPTGLQNQSPTIALAVTVESENGSEAIIRIVGSASDADGVVTGIVCQGQFSGTFGATFDVTRTVTKLAGTSQTFGTTCVATDDDQATASASRSVSIGPIQNQSPLSFSGTGDKVTQLFSVQGGFVTFASFHNGSSNFIVRLRNAQGELEELIVNEIGSYDGIRGFGVQAGQYLLDIDADGTWEVVIRDESGPTIGEPPPLMVMDMGDGIFGPIQLPSGLVRFVMDHTGNSNFIVHLWPSSGGQFPAAFLANEIGTAHVEAAENIATSGIYWLDVQADGQWTINVQ